MNRDASSRVGWVDLFRGMAILLVVFGHVSRGLDHAHLMHYEGGFLDRWIYAFHMPAFFFAAGLFAARSLAKGPARYVVDKLRTVLYPYALWSVIFLATASLFARFSNSPYDPAAWAKLHYAPVGNYWFLYVLFVVQILFLIALAPRWGRPLFWLLCVTGWAVEPWKPLDALAPGDLWALHNVMKYGVYFALGDYVAKRDAEAMEPVQTNRLFGLLSFALLTLLTLMGRSYTDAWWDLPLALAGIQGLWELSVALDRCGPHKWLRFLGQRSLEIYLAHGLAMVAARVLLLKLGVTHWMVHLAFGMFAGVLGPLALWWACDRLRFRYLFTFGGR